MDNTIAGYRTDTGFVCADCVRSDDTGVYDDCKPVHHWHQFSEADMPVCQICGTPLGVSQIRIDPRDYEF